MGLKAGLEQASLGQGDQSSNRQVISNPKVSLMFVQCTVDVLVSRDHVARGRNLSPVWQHLTILRTHGPIGPSPFQPRFGMLATRGIAVQFIMLLLYPAAFQRRHGVRPKSGVE